MQIVRLSPIDLRLSSERVALGVTWTKNQVGSQIALFQWVRINPCQDYPSRRCEKLRKHDTIEYFDG